MGANEFNRSFIHGFGPNSWDKVHHRNIQGIDDNPPDNVKETTPFKFKRSGALIGGPTSAGTFNNSVVDYTCTESGCDYNAGITGALAGLISIMEPYPAISAISFGKGSRQAVTEKGSGFDLTLSMDSNDSRLAITALLDKTGLMSIEVFNARAQVVLVLEKSLKTAGAHTSILKTDAISPGVYFIDLTLGNRSIIRKFTITR